MAVIAPAVLAENTEDYKQRIELIREFTQRVHIDICDGEFAPTMTIPETEAWWQAEWEADVHAMVARPSEHVQNLIAIKPSMIIFHAEVQEDLMPTIQLVRQAGIKAGLALQKPTVPATVAELIGAVDHVLIFSGDLGHYGGTASMMQLEKVRLIRGIAPTVEIGWDGGVNVDNAFSLAQGGVDVLNVGASIAQSAEPLKTYQTLVDEINKHGVI